jgi:hypothetical protein
MFWSLGDLDSLITQGAQASCKLSLEALKAKKNDQRVTPRVVMRIIFLSIFVPFPFARCCKPDAGSQFVIIRSQILSLF